MEEYRPEQHFTRNQEKQLLSGVAAAIKTEFPNPNRCGCPEAEAVRNLARRRIPLPETGALVDHIATCAPCFDAYTRFRHRRRAVRVAGPIVVAVICLIALAVLWSDRVHHGGPAKPAIAQLRAPVRKLTIDWRGTSTTRSVESQRSTVPTPQLPLAWLDLTILLPIGTEDGEYSAEFRAPRVGVVAKSDGTAKWDGNAETLSLRVDLRALTAGEYVLALRKDGSSWRTYSVILEEIK